ncbi:hypothetical protein AQZ52_15845 [Novosphingobium fuchskuhlense]|uniref:Uncharacterized protein n=1 Tax=Novosphingobium fuchskuhlense TaxID=1117702 RepID=A0A117UT21_9SPHN|nr:hypothetical protein [Novosphingobium fuchskuhlense]KUR70319.1 hypothetical protein AQZ52_15845 [Novosphingobium fuchskuhlense]
MPRFTLMLAPCLALALAGGCAHAAGGKKVPLLPARTLTCDLGHTTNVDTSREQLAKELVFDSYHKLSLFLPPIPVRTTEPPDPAFPVTEKVDKRTRIIADPDKITADMVGPFQRVVDMWPERVEMTAPVGGYKVKVLVITNYDEAAHRAQLFMTNAADLASWDKDKIYAGYCDVAITPTAKAGKLR